ncbi:MAG TPA: pyridoxamine 5'-phosphate oxidase family protein [Streptosporangiaceae bacterium]|jgi:nitroimidazol reductase NimA-like FMN-containing flavoprotein (pyridoxamine 5'-phosphate oxidase superfamily)
MSDTTNSENSISPDLAAPAGGPPVLERLDEAECLRLISPGGIGRIAYSGRYGPTVLPVNYRVHEGSIVFRTAHDSPTDEDLRTGIAEAEYKVAFEIDDFDVAAREGWSVLIQGPAHHVESEAEQASVLEAGVDPWPGGDWEVFLRIIPSRITGRRIRRSR